MSDACSKVSVDEVLTKVFESLANPVRRRILAVLDGEGPLPYSELMRRCGIRDSRTLKHHLSKLEPLVIKGRDGTYVATRLGSRVLRVVNSLRDELTEILTLARSPKPLLTFKCSVRHYLLLTAALVTASAALSASGMPYPAAASIILALISLIMAGVRKSKRVIVGRDSVTEIIDTPIVKSERIVRCRPLGAEVSVNALLKLLGLARVSVIVNADGSLRTYSLGVSSISNARKYAEAVDNLIRGYEVSEVLK